MAALAHAVDERRRADALLLAAQILVELEQLGVDLRGDPRALVVARLELGGDARELVARRRGDPFDLLAQRRRPCVRVLGATTQDNCGFLAVPLQCRTPP